VIGALEARDLSPRVNIRNRSLKERALNPHCTPPMSALMCWNPSRRTS
jgi:hypothetical protein